MTAAVALTITATQAVTVVGAPLVAAVLFWLTSQRDIMHSQVNGTTAKTLGGIGLVLLLVIAGKTALITLPTSVRNYREKNQQAEPPPTAEDETAINTVSMLSPTFKLENQ